MPCAAKLTDETLVERTGELNVCDWSGASDQFVRETPGGVIVIVPVIVRTGLARGEHS